MFNRSEVCQFLFNALLLLGYKLSCTILFQMVLAGKRPEIIMEICSRAMSFWSYQVLAIKIIVFYPTKNPPHSPIEGWLIICRLALLAQSAWSVAYSTWYTLLHVHNNVPVYFTVSKVIVAYHTFHINDIIFHPFMKFIILRKEKNLNQHNLKLFKRCISTIAKSTWLNVPVFLF